jgi:hypothetical protein
VERVYRVREGVPGLRFTYEPEHLRFFLGRFEPLAPYPEFDATSGARPVDYGEHGLSRTVPS